MSDNQVILYAKLSTGGYIPIAVDASGNLIISNATEIGQVQARNYGWIAGAWQKDPLKFGFSANLAESITNLNLAAGANTLQGANVPAGQIWIVTTIGVAYSGTILNVRLQSYLSKGGNAYFIYDTTGAAITSAKWYIEHGYWILAAGESVALLITAATAGDDGFLRYAGFKIDINQ